MCVMRSLRFEHLRQSLALHQKRLLDGEVTWKELHLRTAGLKLRVGSPVLVAMGFFFFVEVTQYTQ